jgi:DNA-binding NtrC family response regulator
VVDDEPIISDTLSEILRISGYEARAFYDAETALNACLTCNPDIVISDVVMPGMSGVDLAIEIRERNPSCRIILISGNVGMTDMLESARIRGYDFEVLVKPVPPTELLENLSRPRFAPAAAYLRSNRKQSQTVQNRWSAQSILYPKPQGISPKI